MACTSSRPACARRATSSGPYVHHIAEALPSSPVQSQDSTCRSDEGTFGSISISVFFICLQWLHSCLLAGVSPLLPSPRKIRHRRRQFRGYSNQLAHRRGACGRSRCLESRCHGIPAGPLWTRFLSRFRCPSWASLDPFSLPVPLFDPHCSGFIHGFSLSLLFWMLETRSQFSDSSLSPGAQTLLVPSPVLVALRDQHDMFLSVFPGPVVVFPNVRSPNASQLFSFRFGVP